ncbi:quinoprotein dehydrogenase-associated SoxYZ-like carrier [Inquilinus sp. Marseille-Q2685]|uniref:quinoprotein dehydrogenase-associated SoxYZ-like carrier n=1 Tax=Inquilinus sp. Marseille-Q2685 TaxID=2866581 RepID=UPI001CE46487|nr:quinoprotein dehydrogenase-associated SoxYZ-like carrier [Inquilinus sp. Marseille-Q2685]
MPKHAAALILAALLALAGPARAEDPWPDLKTAIFGDKAVADGSAFMRVEAPQRAYDAAVVPVTIRFDREHRPAGRIRAVTLVVDKNPAPVAAVFRLGDTIADPTIGTRVRVNEYTNIHAVAETEDGSLFMAAAFVKAAGGCSAPATKTPDQAEAHLGEMRAKNLDAVQIGAPSRVELLIRHPNYSGMQMDQIKRTYVPARFIETIEVSYDGARLLQVEGNISLSENPVVEFSFTPTETGRLSATARDSDGAVFTQAWPVPATM